MPNITEVTLPRKIVQDLLHHAQQTSDLEICGLISCRNPALFQVYPIKNIANTPERFFHLDPQQQIQALTTIRNNNEQLFAIYHSHPTAPATPSKTDLEQAAHPEVLTLIISLKTKGLLELRGYKILDEKYTEVSLCLT